MLNEFSVLVRESIMLPAWSMNKFKNTWLASNKDVNSNTDSYLICSYLRQHRALQTSQQENQKKQKHYCCLLHILEVCDGWCILFSVKKLFFRLLVSILYDISMLVSVM